MKTRKNRLAAASPKFRLQNHKISLGVTVLRGGQFSDFSLRNFGLSLGHYFETDSL